MASLFTKIINGEIPGRFIWSDDICVAFLTIEPRTPGHTLIVPRVEVDQWVDLDQATATHCFTVAQTIGHAQREEFTAQRIGFLIEGYEVAHAHLHVWPSQSPADFEPVAAVPGTTAALDDAAQRLRSRLRGQGHTPVPS